MTVDLQTPLTRSSGDLIADRRFAYGEALSHDGDHAAAAELFTQTVEQVPGWAPAWLALALAHERNGALRQALTALDQAVGLDREDRLGASLHRDRIRGQHPAGMAPQFVAELFDQYADRFERHLSETLDYRGPALIRDALLRTGRLEPTADVLDLGCGTGLMARAIAAEAGAIDGVDLSPRMIALARATGLYRVLHTGELAAMLNEAAPNSYDLVLAADVFVYVGALEETVVAAARVMTACGRLALTLQASETAGFALGSDLRFRHHPAYVEGCLCAAGLTPLLIERNSIRREAGAEVPGLVVVAGKA